ncbi:MAG: NADH-quinone oxidoreductase subunit C [Deltaproteobacteria bacterium]|nr:NADH-quinone oxidoreductase subunit C [Deltaproteobacteria bacterium]
MAADLLPLAGLALSPDALVAAVQLLCPAAQARPDCDRPAVKVTVGDWPELAGRLRAHADLLFDLLETHTAIDWPESGRIELVYLLTSLRRGHHLTVFVDIPRDDPVAPSVCAVWPVAQWQEREVYDLFGVRYADHPDLRRLFLDDDWQGFPLRKDYADAFMLDRPS